MKVLFVGSNPSVVAKTYNPFCISTKSGQILLKWVNEVGAVGCSFHCNVSDNITEANRPLTVAQIKANLPRLQLKIDTMAPTKIIALGKTAAKALTLLRLDFYEMPHPSGLNRQLNDPKFVEEKINGLREYLSPLSESL